MVKNDKTLKPKHYLSSDCKTDTVFYDHEVFDKITLVLNYRENFTYGEVVKRIMEVYKTVIIGDEKKPTEGTDDTVFITAQSDGKHKFHTILHKNFTLRNKTNFLALLGKLVAERLIYFIGGSLSYEANGEYVFINIGNIILGSVSTYRKIYRNYGNINCLFKHKYGDVATLFCETISYIYPIAETHENAWHYSFVSVENKEYSPLPGADIMMNGVENVKILFACEKPGTLTRIIYAENLTEGLNLLKKEMKNLGLDIRVEETRRVG